MKTSVRASPEPDIGDRYSTFDCPKVGFGDWWKVAELDTETLSLIEINQIGPEPNDLMNPTFVRRLR